MRALRLLAAAAALAVALPGPAAAHGSSAYVATFREVTPALAGVQVRVAGGRIVLTSRSRKTVVVESPNGEPYLRFRRGRVDANLGTGRRPRWVRVARGRRFRGLAHASARCAASSRRGLPRGGESRHLICAGNQENEPSWKR